MMNESEQGHSVSVRQGVEEMCSKQKEELCENSSEEELLVLLKELKEGPSSQNMVSHSED